MNLAELVSAYHTQPSAIRTLVIEEAWSLALCDLESKPYCLMLIRAATTDQNKITRNTAVEALGQLGSRSDGYRLKLAALDRDWIVRASAVSSLATSIGKSARSQIERILRSDASPIVRAYAAVALCDAVGTSALDTLSIQIKQEKNSIALTGYLAAFLSLKRIEEASSLIFLLHDKERITRERAISALEVSREWIKTCDSETIQLWQAALETHIKVESLERLTSRYASFLSSLSGESENA